MVWAICYIWIYMEWSSTRKTTLFGFTQDAKVLRIGGWVHSLSGGEFTFIVSQDQKLSCEHLKHFIESPVSQFKWTKITSIGFIGYFQGFGGLDISERTRIAMLSVF